MKKLLLIFCIFLFTGVTMAQVDDTESTNSLLYYSGTLGFSQKVELNLQLKGYTVSGSYILEATGDQYVFSGRMSLDRSGFGALVYDENNQYIASVEAYIISEENNFGKQIKGNWKSANGKRTQMLDLTKVAEFAKCESANNSPVFGE